MEMGGRNRKWLRAGDRRAVGVVLRSKNL